MIRLTTIAETLESAPWTPADETYLQLAASNDQTTVDVQARVSTDAAWVTVTTLHRTSTPIVRIAKFPSLRLVARNNLGGQTLNVWDNT
ncbi:hypothetical protein [Agrobacterium tumefaciens]|uniref:hypothetical protein n=1 Tax=Agrobacterium tumefaciens TaxID=358 RepID=UPI00080FBF3B|nr:hypothetical protein [Agrobacterium tumefaciens]NSL22357.1 hypothetical protein [Agrobacterium tumefaciens]NTC57256.1 hypothetical protein [Agrobacterium tumefaciens]NTC62090.1 hypothetical protein [Agrobacterium tumefaciens]NTC65820.1 hypothetical protein [Agrobacterium tumefaciens]NTC74400.1 hypothetical protein [Agrobacterium tumefaciens]